jgi:hypothetical protein
MKFILFLTYLTGVFGIKCDYKGDDAFIAANYIVKSINENNSANFICSLNKGNHERIGTQTKAIRTIEEIKAECGSDLREVKEIRIRTFKKKTFYYCKTIVKEKTVYCLVLTKEHGAFYFEDFHSPDKVSFEGLELYKP